MQIEIINQPLRFRLLGLFSSVGNRSYGEVGCQLMDKLWRIVKAVGLKTTGTNHWAYIADDRMFVGVEVGDGQQVAIPESLETLECELARCAKHVHVGPYCELPEKWRALKAELTARGERVTMPSLEVYGHSCEGDDESKAETTILMGLSPKEA
jgi:effector-binding domain-containing protein